MNTNTLIIGVTGPLGGGVTTVSKTLAGKLGFVRASLADAIKRQLAQQEGRSELLDFDEDPDRRKKLQDIGNEERLKDPAVWVKKALENLNAPEKLVLDGIRNMREVWYLREAYPHFFLVAVYASKATRWTRLSKKYCGNAKVFERDDRRDRMEDTDNGQQVTSCVDAADYVIVNEGTQKSSAAISSAVENKIGDAISLMEYADRPKPCSGVFLRPPTQDEVHMATAYAQSHMSRCLKRHVGAVIVSAQNIPLSLGYNENPIGMEPCEKAYGYCFKDDDMHKRIEGLAGRKCPACGTDIRNPKPPWKCECGEDLKTAFFPSRNMERCTAIHAEERAIRSLSGRSSSHATIYSTTFPCFQCARYIVDAEMFRVVYVEAYPIEESGQFLAKNNVQVDAFEGFKARAFNRVFRQVE